MISKTLLVRLLSLFPIESLREHFTTRGQGKHDVSGYVVDHNSAADVTEFILKNLSKTKQHVHLYQLKDAAAGFPEVELCGQKPFTRSGPSPDCWFTYLIPVTFTYFSITEKTEGEIEFLWPVRLHWTRSTCELYTTTMEKDIASYLPDEELIANVKRDLDEKIVLLSLHLYFNETKIDFLPLGLNEGVKALWEAGHIDAIGCSYLEATETINRAMHEKNLLKRNNPAGYKEAISKPLLKTAFMCESKTKDYPSIFVVDPSAGAFTFTRYGSRKDEISNVIQDIIKNNR